MPQAEKPSAAPFQVWVVGGSIHSGHQSEALALVACARANKISEKLGTKARFEVRSA